MCMNMDATRILVYVLFGLYHVDAAFLYNCIIVCNFVYIIIIIVVLTWYNRAYPNRCSIALSALLSCWRCASSHLFI